MTESDEANPYKSPQHYSDRLPTPDREWLFDGAMLLLNASSLFLVLYGPYIIIIWISGR
jgi:hypothetical protein